MDTNEIINKIENIPIKGKYKSVAENNAYLEGINIFKKQVIDILKSKNQNKK